MDGEEPAAVPLNTIRYLPHLDEQNSAPRAKTRQRVPVLLNLVAALKHPADAESVSLRASATDRDGNTVKETLIRATSSGSEW